VYALLDVADRTALAAVSCSSRLDQAVPAAMAWRRFFDRGAPLAVDLLELFTRAPLPRRLGLERLRVSSAARRSFSNSLARATLALDSALQLPDNLLLLRHPAFELLDPRLAGGNPRHVLVALHPRRLQCRRGGLQLGANDRSFGLELLEAAALGRRARIVLVEPALRRAGNCFN